MELLEQLAATKARTLAYFDLPEADLDRTYAPGKWPVRFLLHHLADAERVLYDRICRVLSEPRGVIWAFDQDAWAQGLGYAAKPLGLSRSLYAAVREAVIYHARTSYEAEGHRTFVHSETGVRTLKDEFDKVAWHNAHHLAQIEQALRGG